MYLYVFCLQPCLAFALSRSRTSQIKQSRGLTAMQLNESVMVNAEDVNSLPLSVAEVSISCYVIPPRANAVPRYPVSAAMLSPAPE
ncbi:hypothetical protein B0I37DRAFT_39691 [Chaetomium sp. MPI-CAGE-AT-0009]|nr:hypothetical protein B0I37DRAFT_39691 [Chaetomium sp. MPI-CAGE-AT-0009]